MKNTIVYFCRVKTDSFFQNLRSPGIYLLWKFLKKYGLTSFLFVLAPTSKNNNDEDEIREKYIFAYLLCTVINKLYE